MKKEIVLSNVFNYTSAENNLNKRFDKSATIFKNKLYNILQKIWSEARNIPF